MAEFGRFRFLLGFLVFFIYFDISDDNFHNFELSHKPFSAVRKLEYLFVPTLRYIHIFADIVDIELLSPNDSVSTELVFIVLQISEEIEGRTKISLIIIVHFYQYLNE